MPQNVTVLKQGKHTWASTTFPHEAETSFPVPAAPKSSDIPPSTTRKPESNLLFSRTSHAQHQQPSPAPPPPPPPPAQRPTLHSADADVHQFIPPAHIHGDRPHVSFNDHEISTNPSRAARASSSRQHSEVRAAASAHARANGRAVLDDSKHCSSSYTAPLGESSAHKQTKHEENNPRAGVIEKNPDHQAPHHPSSRTHALRVRSRTAPSHGALRRSILREVSHVPALQPHAGDVVARRGALPARSDVRRSLQLYYKNPTSVDIKNLLVDERPIEPRRVRRLLQKQIENPNHGFAYWERFCMEQYKVAHGYGGSKERLKLPHPKKAHTRDNDDAEKYSRRVSRSRHVRFTPSTAGWYK